jgi:hypothetical protein
MHKDKEESPRRTLLRGTPIYIKEKDETPFLTIGRNNERKKHKGLDIEQIYGHGSQRGSMPGMTVPADCPQ